MIFNRLFCWVLFSNNVLFNVLFVLFCNQYQESESSDVDTSSTVTKQDDVNNNIATNVSSSNKKSKKKKKKKNKVKDMNLLLKDGVDSFDGKHQPSEKNPKDVNGAGRRCNTNILQVDPKFLSADNELRRIFGSKVVDSFEKSNQAGSYRQNRSQAGSSRQNRVGRRVIIPHKKTIIISPSEHWPRWDGSLSMELLQNKNGCNYFRHVLLLLCYIFDYFGLYF